MKPEALLRSLDELDESLLLASERPLMEHRRRPALWLAAAAALVIVASLGYLTWRLFDRRQDPALTDSPTGESQALSLPALNDGQGGQPTPTPTEQTTTLPLLEAGDSYHEDMLTESRDEAWQRREYLWQQWVEFETLPVFEARSGNADSTAPILDAQAMEQMLNTIAQAVGFDEPEIYPAVYNLPTNGTLPDDAWDYVAQSGDQSIWIRSDGRVQVNFGQAQKEAFSALPEETKMVLWEDRSCAEEYYVNLYFELLEIPYREDADLYLESTMASIDPRYSAGRSGDDVEERYLADVLRNVVLELDDEGCLQSMAFDACFRERWLPLGDYPIINYADAQALAQRGQYYTDGLDGSKWSEWKYDAIDWNCNYFTHGELIYLRSDPAVLRLPYYRFFVQVHIRNDQTQEETTVYLPVYVPAIRAEYLSDMPEPIPED